jgi:HD domain
MVAAHADGRRWSARPWGARAVRVVAFGLPIAASVAVVQLLTQLTGIPTSSLFVFLAWWSGATLVASVVVSALYSVTKRLLPLGGLLGLSLVFPDQAPSRFRIALSAGTVESLQARLQQMHDRGEEASAQEAAEILLQLVAALDVHDRITRGHAERVRGYAAGLGRALGLSRDDLDRLNWSALLHDVGKLEVAAEILNKPGRPTDEEWETLRRHPLEGELLVAPLRGWLGEWIEAVGCHHENWDGTGYPRGIAGEAIPLAGRIVAIADVYDVITSVRSYKEAATPAEARAELVSCAGAQFDPRLVRAFVSISLGRMRLLAGPLAWLSNAPLLTRIPLAPSLGATIGGVAALATAATATPAVAHRPELVRPVHLRQPTPSVAVVFVPHDPAPVVVASVARGRRRVRHASARTPPRPTHATPTVATTPVKAPKPPVATKPTPPPPPTTAVPHTTTTTTPPPKPRPLPPTTTTTPAPKPPPTTAPTPPPTTTAPAPPPPVNVAPTFTVGSSLSVLEDSGAQTVPGWATAISPGSNAEGSQTVRFTVSTDNPALFAVAPAVASDGTLTFTSAGDANGIAHVNVVAVDDGGTANGGHDTSASQAFTVTVTAVNDAPSFTPGANQTAVSLLGAETVNGWAKAISAGPADESSQTVGFTVTVSNPSLFSMQPAISATGTLTYKPKALVLGSATVTVTPFDSGGTDNGGQDTGPPRTFTITIL